MDLYCEIFVDADLSPDQLAAMVAASVGGVKGEWGYVSSKLCDIYVNSNSEFHESKRWDEAEGFLFFKYTLDIEPKAGIDRQEYVNSISVLLQYLWRSTFRAVASCDFEQELTESGGYRDSRIAPFQRHGRHKESP